MDHEVRGGGVAAVFVAGAPAYDARFSFSTKTAVDFACRYQCGVSGR